MSSLPYTDGQILPRSFVGTAWFMRVATGNIVVSGAGTAEANGLYEPDGESNGRPRFTKVGGETDDDSIYWNGVEWYITASGVVLYDGIYDVDSPDLVSEWIIDSGTPPVPTVTAELVDLSFPYIFNNCNSDVPTLEVTRNGIAGTVAASGAMTLEQERISFTGEIQVNTQNLIRPLIEAYFVIPSDSLPTETAIAFKVRSMGPSVQSGNARTASVDCIEAFQAPTLADGSMVVEGAGSDNTNGIWTVVGTVPGRPQYGLNSLNVTWLGSAWAITNGSAYYASSENVATPDLVNTWQIGPVGSAPAPTVRRATILDI